MSDKTSFTFGSLDSESNKGFVSIPPKGSTRLDGFKLVSKLIIDPDSDIVSVENKSISKLMQEWADAVNTRIKKTTEKSINDLTIVKPTGEVFTLHNVEPIPSDDTNSDVFDNNTKYLFDSTKLKMVEETITFGSPIIFHVSSRVQEFTERLKNLHEAGYILYYDIQYFDSNGPAKAHIKFSKPISKSIYHDLLGFINEVNTGCQKDSQYYYTDGYHTPVKPIEKIKLDVVMKKINFSEFIKEYSQTGKYGYGNLPTTDGIHLAPGTPFLLKNQSDSSINGVYTYSAKYGLTRGTKEKERNDKYFKEVVDAIFNHQRFMFLRVRDLEAERTEYFMNSDLFKKAYHCKLTDDVDLEIGLLVNSKIAVFEREQTYMLDYTQEQYKTDIDEFISELEDGYS